MSSYDFAFLDADKRMYHQYLRCFFNWYVDLASHISVWEDKIDRGKNSNLEKDMSVSLCLGESLICFRSIFVGALRPTRVSEHPH